MDFGPAKVFPVPRTYSMGGRLTAEARNFSDFARASGIWIVSLVPGAKRAVSDAAFGWRTLDRAQPLRGCRRKNHHPPYANDMPAASTAIRIARTRKGRMLSDRPPVFMTNTPFPRPIARSH